jgi:hypothetical protein
LIRHITSFLVLISSVMATNAYADQNEFIREVLFEMKVDTISSVAIQANGESIAFITDKELEGQSWVSELNLLDLKTKQSRLIIPSSDLKSYAVYGAFASNPKWINENVIQINISDGDVGFAEVLYDTNSSNLNKGEMTDVDDWSEEKHTRLFRLFKSCFSDIEDSVIFSGQLDWLVEGQSAIYQARHVNADNSVWYIDLKNCSRQLIVNAGDNKSNEFKGWLSGYTLIDEQLLIMLASGYPVKRSDLFMAKLDGSKLTGIENLVSYNNNGFLSFLGTTKSSLYFKLTFNKRGQCSTRIVKLNGDKLIEYRFKDRLICDASMTESQGLIAFITKAELSEVRFLSVALVD